MCVPVLAKCQCSFPVLGSLARRKTASQKEQISEYKAIVAKRLEEKKQAASAAKERRARAAAS